MFVCKYIVFWGAIGWCGVFLGEWVGCKSPESRLVLRLATVTCSLDDVHVLYEPFLVKVEAVF